MQTLVEFGKSMKFFLQNPSPIEVAMGTNEPQRFWHLSIIRETLEKWTFVNASEIEQNIMKI